MNAKLSILALASVASLAACGGSGNAPAAATPISTAFDPAKVTFAAIETPITSKPAGVVSYDGTSFDSKNNPGNSAVSYSGQSARQILIADMTSKIKSYTTDIAAATVTADMNFFLDGPTDAANYTYAISGQTLIPSPTYGDISTGKTLRSKMAGEDKAEHIIGGKLLGWSTGLDADPTPSEFIDYLVGLLNTEVTNTTTPEITAIGGNVSVDVSYIDGEGRDFAQLIQKFMLGAVTFSQGTADYLKTDFSSGHDRDKGTKDYSTAEHKWDEAFGYFGAAQDYDSYTDAEIKSKTAFFKDSDGVAGIDIRAEINQANSVNCAKRDEGATVTTDYTQQAFNAFLTGRKQLNDSATGTTTDGALSGSADDLAKASKQAAQVWEMCIAATVVHYINDVNDDLDGFINAQGKFADLSAYKNLAKHWSEMKGFALGLQFNPESPFHQSADTLKVYEAILAAMGDKPDFSSIEAATTYKANLLTARGLMQNAYGFDADNVANW